MKKHTLLLAVLLILCLVICACSQEPADPQESETDPEVTQTGDMTDFQSTETLGEIMETTGPESNDETASESESNSTTDSESDSESDSQSDSQSESESDSESDSQSDTETETESDTKGFWDDFPKLPGGTKPY